MQRGLAAKNDKDITFQTQYTNLFFFLAYYWWCESDVVRV